MRAFKDNSGRDWSIAVNTSAIKRIRAELDVDLMDVVEGDLLRRLYADPILLVDVIYVACKPQADEAGVTDEQFGEAMAGDAIDRATAALVEELVDFFPNRRDRERARRVLAKVEATVERIQDVMDLKADSPALQKQLDQIVESVGASFIGSPESPASTPAP